ncbi:MAG: CPBP family intramembrane glutamic endopeptidase [Usitatibacteraceae bacterium]
MEASAETTDPKRDRQALVVFLVLAICLSAIASYPIIKSGQIGAWDGMAVRLLMWAPGVSGLISAVLVFRSLRPLGLLGNRKVLFWIIVCLLVPFAYTLVIYPFLAAVGWVSLGTRNFTASFFIVGLLFSLLNALGEELGWRGFAAPVVSRVFGFWRGQSILGIVWFLYHLPILLLTDYGQSPHPFFGNLMFLITVVGLSYFLGWARQQSDSVWPCAIFHASHNLVFQHLFDPMTIQNPSATWLQGEQGLMLAATNVLLAACVLFAYRHRR